MNSNEYKYQIHFIRCPVHHKVMFGGPVLAYDGTDYSIKLKAFFCPRCKKYYASTSLFAKDKKIIALNKKGDRLTVHNTNQPCYTLKGRSEQEVRNLMDAYSKYDSKSFFRKYRLLKDHIKKQAK